MTNILNSAFSRDIAHVLHPTTNLADHQVNGALIITRGEGIFVFDESGKKYIEGLAGLWCKSLGFSQESLVEAAAEQMRRLPFYHGFGSKGNLPTIDLAEKIKEMVPFEASKVFFANSGSEANDTQIKLFRYYNNAIGRPERKKIISRQKAYHGVTLATAELTGLPSFREGFDVSGGNVLHTDYPHYYRGAEPGESEEAYVARLAANLEKLIIENDPDTIAAFIAEPVMGGAGVVVPPAGYFEAVQEVLGRYEIRFIADEVICGFGRTGNMFGCETFGIEPDTMTLAKQLSSGYLPISAVVIPEDIFQVIAKESGRIGVFGHGYTYGGHPVAAAVAFRTLELYEELNILDHVKAVAPHFQDRLAGFAEHPLVGEAKGVGLIGAVELVADKAAKRPFEPARRVGARAASNCISHGLINRASGDRLVFSPPLIITEAEINMLFDRLGRALDDTLDAIQREGW